jgi:hypothetical protein
MNGEAADRSTGRPIPENDKAFWHFGEFSLWLPRWHLSEDEDGEPLQ